MKRLIWWCRRDLRLADNTALNAALHDADEVLPVYVLDDKLLAVPRVQGPRIAWMLDGLRVLDSDLRVHSAALVLRRGDPVAELIAVCREAGASGVYFNRDYGPYATKRDQGVTAALQAEGFEVQSFKDLVIHELPEVVTGQRTTYGVFTPYRIAWNKLPKPEVIDNADLLKRLHVPPTVNSLPIPTSAELNSVSAQEPIAPPGEAAALDRLEQFVAGPIYAYAEERNTLATDGTAILSPYLRWGMISPRTCNWAAQHASNAMNDPEKRRNVEAWISELTWREFSYQNLASNPRSVRHNFRPIYDKLRWENNPDWLAAWREGQTGYPIVDAAMRQMRITGWMHNRARLIVASFLCKDLLIDWRLGEAVFMQRLLDGDLASNVGNWQWSAGTGTDAAPYFRIFNPTSQGEKFDPNGDYIRQWVPELANVPTKFIHAPAAMTLDQQTKFSCVIGLDYPAPLVDHAVQRERALALYGAARD